MVVRGGLFLCFVMTVITSKYGLVETSSSHTDTMLALEQGNPSRPTHHLFADFLLLRIPYLRLQLYGQSARSDWCRPSKSCVSYLEKFGK